MRGRKLNIIAAAAAVLAAQAGAQTAPSPLPSDAEIRQLLVDRIDVQHKSVGTVVGITTPQGRRIISYGRSDKGGQRQLDGDTVFEIGSLTKVFTALLLTDAVQRGEVALADPVAKYLPAGVKVPERNGRKIELVDLATHTSGLPFMPTNMQADLAALSKYSKEQLRQSFSSYTDEDLYQFLSTYELPRDIGSKWGYSNLGMGLVGKALARRAGMDYESLVRLRITGPLEMKSTAIAVSPEMKARLAAGHLSNLEPAPDWALPALAGAGSLRSSANDLLTLVEAFTGYLKIAEQFGIGYLPLTVMKANRLVEKHLKAAGLADTKVVWSTLASGQPMNDALLSGSLHIASGGVAPFLILWDRTRGGLNVKAVAALASMPMYLVTNNPNVKSIRDFTDKDRISMAGAGQSIQTIVLQMAAAKEFGDANFNKFSTLYRNLSHPDGLAAFLSGTEITAYFSSPPFQYQALQKPGVRRILNSYDISGGPATFLVAWATGKFRDENPKTYQAFFNAYKEATDYINANKRAAAEIYVREAKDKSGVDAILKMLNDPEIRITMTPEQTLPIADFMQKTGTLKGKAASWKDLYFPELHNLPGS